MRSVSLCLLSAFAISAQAQDAAEFGVRYWYSQSVTKRSHNAQDLVPSLGNPTSVLTYEDLYAHAVELHGRKSFGQGWFVRGNAGLGTIKRGSFDDEDFNVGQVKFQDTTSTVKGNKLTYAMIDLGRDLWQFRNGTAGLFVGYQYWSERLDAYGVVFTVPSGGGTLPESVPVITNDVTWHSLRVGFTATSRLSSRTRLALDAAWVPYATVRDEDSHWLREDPSSGAFFLGPAPNIIIEGRGHGLQLDFELRHAVADNWEFGAGVRHWWLQARSGSRTALGTSVPLVELESWRTGVTLSLTHRW